MIELLVGIIHGTGGQPAPHSVIADSLQIVDRMKPGDSLGLEGALQDIEDGKILNRIGDAKTLKDAVEIFESLDMQIPRHRKFKGWFDSQPQKVFDLLKKTATTTLFPQLLKEAEKRNLTVVPLESAVARRFFVQMNKEAGERIITNFDRHARVNEAGAYAMYPLREKGILSRLKKYQPTVSFIGAEHLENLVAYNGKELEVLGIDPCNIRRIYAGRKIHAVHRSPTISHYMQDEKRRVPGSFRKKKK
jgi:hypothetical protein